MAELAPNDVAAFTRSRLPADAGTQLLIDAALAAARRYCGWHVSPVRTGDVVEVDGPGHTSAVLSLPTLHLLDVTDIVEDGVDVNVARDVYWSRTGNVYKRGWARGWTPGPVVVTITHGYTEAEAADWRRAVLRLVDQMSLEPFEAGTRPSSDVVRVREKVDDVETEIQYGATLIADSDRLSALFAQFRILPGP